MSYIVVDVETDGNLIGKHSMICFGAVVVTPTLDKTFYGCVKPLTEHYMPEAAAISGISRQEHEAFEEPRVVMQQFCDWVEQNSKGKPVFFSDNPAFDWQWINYYFLYFIGKNPFGYSARRIGDLYCGLVKDASKNNEWKEKYRKTIHDHNPVNDAKGNAEALLAFKDLGLKISF